MTGNFLSAEEAYEWGLVNRIVPPDELIPTCQQLARDMLSTVPSVMYEYKRQIDRAYDLSLGDAMNYEVDICRRHVPPKPEVVEQRRAEIRRRAREQLSEG